MSKKQSTTNTWRENFVKEFCENYDPRYLRFLEKAQVEDVIQFIAKLIAQERKEYNKAIEALIWCSGSDDFHFDGKARKGWEKICQPLLKNRGIKDN